MAGWRRAAPLVAALVILAALPLACELALPLDGYAGTGHGGDAASSGDATNDATSNDAADSQADAAGEGGGVDATGSCDASANDPKNCGACGHDCLGGGCAAGVCQPFQLVGQQPHASGIAVTATDLYWANYSAGQIATCVLSNCAGTVRVFANNQALVGFLAVDKTDIFWTTVQMGDAWKCSFTDCSNPFQLYCGQDTAGITTDGTRVYWADQASGGDSGVVVGCDVSGSNRATIASGLAAPIGVGVGPAGLYWTNSGDGTLWSSPLDGGAAVQMGSNLGSPGFLKLDAQRVYWASGNGVGACPLAGCGIGDANIVTFGGTGPAAFDVAVDANNVYWTEFVPNGRILSCPLTGCGMNPTVLFQNGSKPANITVDAVAIYWTAQDPNNDSAGTVWRLAK